MTNLITLNAQYIPTQDDVLLKHYDGKHRFPYHYDVL